MKKIVFIRHGQSLYNLENRFTGWLDVDLTDEGYNGAREAGAILKKHGFTFDVAYTSVLKRAIRTCWILLNEMDLVWIQVKKSWGLNERHYGGLQGLNKDEVIARFGEEQVNEWRRSVSVRPPALSRKDHAHYLADPKYIGLGADALPFTESLLDTEKRAVSYWKEAIVPDLQQNKRVIISAHGNTLRALVKNLDQIPDEEVTSINIPNSIPLVYELDDNLTLSDTTTYVTKAKQERTASLGISTRTTPKTASGLDERIRQKTGGDRHHPFFVEHTPSSFKDCSLADRRS